MGNNPTQRDAFFNRVYDRAKLDRRIVLLSADMGAPSLDKFRKDLPGQFVNAGIAEQNAITVAAGLTLTGKKVFIYGIVPFITLRCLEQLRVECAMMDLPITIAAVGAGLGYHDSGPTHHAVEDIAVMRTLPHVTIDSITDAVMARAAADWSCTAKSPNYVRFDRCAAPVIYPEGHDFSRGFSVLKNSGSFYIVATGAMTHTALAVAGALAKRGLAPGVIDAFRFPFDEKEFVKIVGGVKKIVSLEEHFLPGGLGSMLCEVLCDHDAAIPVRRLGIPLSRGFCYEHGDREALRAHYNLDEGSIERRIVEFVERNV